MGWESCQLELEWNRIEKIGTVLGIKAVSLADCFDGEGKGGACI